jgi:hypothetical protein
MRFNPPPNWPPAPPGWTPPPGWQPDRSWPPLPPGWPLWVPEPRRRKTGLILGALAATLLIAVGVVVAIVAANRTATTAAPTTGTPTGTAAQTDEEQIEVVVEKYAQAWNDEDFAAFEPIVCEDMRNAEEFNEKDFLDARGIRDDMDVAVTSVEVDGDTATASVQQAGEQPNDIKFVREDGGWKWCEL